MKRNFTLVFCFFILVFSCATSAIIKPCVFQINGYEFDLSPLVNQTYSVTDDFGNEVLFGICTSVPGCAGGTSAVCQYNGNQYTSYGSINQMVSVANQGSQDVSLIYYGGATCSSFSLYSTSIKFTCASTTSGASINEAIASCSYYSIYISSPYGCGKSLSNPLPEAAVIGIAVAASVVGLVLLGICGVWLRRKYRREHQPIPVATNYVPYSPPPARTRISCSTCSGKGRVECSYCGGSGFVKLTLTVENNYGATSTSEEKVCTKCGGPGTQSCERCRGSGTL